MELIFIILLIIFIKAVLNFYKLKRLLKLEAAYKNYINHDTSWDFHEKKQEIITLLKGAGLKSSCVPYLKPADFGFVTKHNLDLFDNLAFNNEDINLLILSNFRQAAGVYKKRLLDSINSLYWLEVIIFLPQKVIDYIGFNGESKIVAAVSKTINITKSLEKKSFLL